MPSKGYAESIKAARKTWHHMIPTFKLGRVYQKRETPMTVGLRLVDGLDMGPHSQDVIDHAGTPLGDMLFVMQVKVAAAMALADMYKEMNKSWWERIRDWIMRR